MLFCVSRVAQQAGADGFVADGSALGVDAADAAQTAGVLADGVDASLVERTIAVRAAAGYARRRHADLAVTALLVPPAVAFGHFFAGNPGIAGEARLAGTDLSVVDGGARGVPSADAASLARILALVVDAGEVGRTVGIASAPHCTFCPFTYAAVQAVLVTGAPWRWYIFHAAVSGVSRVTRKAGADAIVVDCLADGIDSARSERAARVLAHPS